MVVGYIERFISDKNARIKVLAFERADSLVMDEQQIKMEFTPYGYVFEDSFAIKYVDFNKGDFIRFSVTENPYSVGHEDKDRFKIKSIKNKLDYEVIFYDDFLINDKAIDMVLLQSLEKELPDRFFLQNGVGYYGPFKKINGIVKPIKGVSVNFRKFLTNTISYENKTIVFGHPKKSEILIDASTNEQLQKWFKELLKISNTKFSETLLSNKDWKSQLLSLPIEEFDLEKAKLNRVISYFDKYESTLEELENLSNVSHKLQGFFKEKVDLFKNDIIKQKEVEIEKAIKQLTLKVLTLKAEEKGHEEKIEDLIIEKQKIENDYNHIVKNKDRLLADFKVFQNLTISTEVTPFKHESPLNYLVKESDINLNSLKISKTQFDELISQFLAKRRKKTETIKFRTLREMIASFNCIFSNSLELVLAFIEATNNYRYIISQVEVKWLSFNDFWESGLRDIWLLAHNDPNILHFLILRDCNLSSPECYAAPLLDVDRELRESLPYDARSWPNNLRIIATTQPVPEVGLPILKSTFYNWGGLANLNLIDTPKQIPKDSEGYLTVAEFNSWIVDKTELIGDNRLEEYLD